MDGWGPGWTHQDRWVRRCLTGTGGALSLASSAEAGVVGRACNGHLLPTPTPTTTTSQLSNKTRSSTPAHTTYCRPRPCTQPLLRSPRRPCIQRPRVHLTEGRVTDRSRTRYPLLATSNSSPFLATLGSRATCCSLLTSPAINRAASQSLSPDRTSLLAMLLTRVYPHGSSCSSLPSPHSVPCTSSGDDLAQMARTTIRRYPGSSPDTSCRA